MQKKSNQPGRSTPLITRWFAKRQILIPSIFLLLFSFDLLAQVPTIDGNPAEWPGILNNSANTRKAFKHDPFNVNHIDDSWTGGSQDGDASPSADWTWVYGNSNDKGDIGNAGAVLLGTRLYFFGDRSSFSGDAQIGFWFFLNNVQPTGNGENPGSPFIGEHANGDLLIISNFTNGGGNAVPTIYRWTGKTATEPGGPVAVTNATAALSTNGSQYNVPGGATGQLMFNGETWSFSPKSGTANTYPPPLFFEGYVDLASITGLTPCFQRFLLETRNSQSIGASLQDLVAGAFSGVPPAPSTSGGARCGAGIVNLSASGCTGGTLNWYNAATGGTLVTTGTSYAPNVSQTTSYWVSCITNDGCEGPRTQVTATIYPIPSVNGLVQTKAGVTQVSVGSTLLDDIYQIKISTTNTADVYVDNPISGATYAWTRINCTSSSAYVDDGKTTFSSSGPNGTFTVINTQGIAAAYCFQVSVSVDNGGGIVCTSLDTVEIRPTSTAILCAVSGPPTVCASSTGNSYILDGDANAVADALDPEFNYVWSISGGGGTIDGAAGDGTKSGVNSITVTAGAGAGNYTVTLTITGKNNSLQDPPPCSASTVVKLVTLSLDRVNVSCNGGNNGSVTATFGGGTAPYKIQINGGTYVDPATSPHSFTGLVAGSYTVHVVDANNCEASGTIAVSEPDALDLVLTPTHATCYGATGSISAAVTGTPLSDLEIKIDAGSYANVSASPVVFSGLAAGSHTVTLRRKSDNSCLVSKSVVITQPDALDLALTPTGASCYGSSNGSISAAITGTPLSDLEIKIGSGSYADVTASPVVFSGLAAGSHTVTMRRKSDNSCLVSKSAVVTQPDALDLILTPTGATCYAVSNGSISAAVTGTPLSDLEIKIDAGSYADVAASPVVFSGLAAGSHTVTLRRKSDNSCLVAKSATVTQPDALTLSLTKGDVSCNGNDGSITATFGGGSGSYEAKLNEGSWASASSPKTFSGLAAGVHTVYIRDANDNNCTISGSITINNPTSCAHLFPTQTTCCNYLNGNTANFQQRYICYSVVHGKVGQNANPGVFFYYGDFTITTTSNVEIVVRETRSNLNKLWNFSAQNSSNVRLLSESCGSITPNSIELPTSLTGEFYDVVIRVNSLPAGKYVVSVKYDTKSIVGSPAGGSLEVTYSFSMSVNNTSVPNSTGQLIVTTNSSVDCSAPIPDGSCSSPVTAPLANATMERSGGLKINAYPNPYAQQINFRFVAPFSGKAQLEVFDLLGRKLDVLYSAQVAAGAEKNILYHVPSSRMIPMIYRLTVGDKTIHGTVLPDKQ